MGICSSSNDADGGKPLALAGASKEDESTALKIIERVTVLVLDQCTQCLENEKEAYTELAITMNLDPSWSYLGVIKGDLWDKFLKDNFNYEDFEEDDGKHKCEKDFRSLIDACKQGSLKDGDSKVLIDSLQKLCVKTQKNMKEAVAAANSSDIKIHLNFFHGCFSFPAGAIQGSPSTLEQNVDKILSEPQE